MYALTGVSPFFFGGHMPYAIVLYKSHHIRTISPYYMPDHVAVLEVTYNTHSISLLHYLYLPMLLYSWVFTNTHMVAAIVTNIASYTTLRHAALPSTNDCQYLTKHNNLYAL